MSKPIIEVNSISKRYNLGQIGMSSFRDESEKWLRRLRGQSQADPSPVNKKEFWALRDVSFSIQPGEVVGIIGRNGAGKSTLLKVLSRITEPTSGEAILRGRVGSLLEVGTGFHPELSGRDNIFLNGTILGMKRAEIASKFDEIVAFAEIDKFIDTPVKRYSSGMYVRLAFAVAAHLEPEILIIDEVLAVGDAQFQKKCIGRIQEISHNHGRTILLVSHYMATIKRLCQKCLVLSGGRSEGILPVEKAVDIYNKPARLTNSSIDVANRPRDWGAEARDLRILEVRIVEPASGLCFNEPFELEFRIKVTRENDGLMLGVAFNTIDGQRILTLDSDANGKTFSLSRGEHLVRFRIPSLPLHPAIYAVSASIGQGRFFHDIIDPFANWEVHAGHIDWESDRSFGGCRLSPEISLNPS